MCPTGAVASSVRLCVWFSVDLKKLIVQVSPSLYIGLLYVNLLCDVPFLLVILYT